MATANVDDHHHHNTVDAKASLRQEIRAKLKSLSAEKMAQDSRDICSQILSSGILGRIQSACLYVSCDRLREVSTNIVLQHLRIFPDESDEAITIASSRESRPKVFLPRVADSDSNMDMLEVTAASDLTAVPPFGILEPGDNLTDGTPRRGVIRDALEIDLIFVPGLGFDRNGRRLGRGGGYYDCFIERAYNLCVRKGKAPPLLVGLAFEEQIAVEVPCDAHDRMVDVLVLPGEVICCTALGRARWIESRGCSSVP